MPTSTPYAQVNQEVEAQEPLLRVTTSPTARKFYRLQPGKRGNLQTAQLMANLVREDAVKNKKLELFAAQILAREGLDSHSDPYEVADAIFRFVQTLRYVHDPAGAFDSVQSAEVVLKERKGDCDDLSVLLATLLAMVGFKPRFVMARYKEDSEGFDHVYVDLELARGRVALDPSSRKHGIGWESPRAFERVAYPIFDGKVIGLGELARKAAHVFQSLNGFGCVPIPHRDSCGARSNASAQSAGSDDGGSLAGVTLSLPAILFGGGMVIVALKAVDYATRTVFGERWR